MLKLRKRLNILLVALLLSGAQEAPSPTVLPYDQMVAILVDLELAKALVEHCSDDAAMVEAWLRENALRIYEEHATTAEVFQESYQNYIACPELMGTVYEAVIEKVETILQSL